MMGDDRIRLGPRDTPRSRTPSPTKRPPRDVLTVQQDAVATALRRRTARLKALDDNDKNNALAIARGGSGSDSVNTGTGSGGLLLDGTSGVGNSDSGGNTVAVAAKVVLVIEDG